MLEGKDKPLDEQIKVFEKIILKSPTIDKVLKTLADYAEKNKKFSNYYLAAGSINQTILNYYHQFPLESFIKDLDIVYYDSDTSYEAEDKIIKELSELLKDIPLEFDIKNEARVHLWYKEKYQNEIEPYKNIEDAIKRWGTTITCIGIRLENSKLKIYAPYGLNDLFNLIIRPVKYQFQKESYLEKTSRWKKNWPLLEIKDWDSI